MIRLFSPDLDAAVGQATKLTNTGEFQKAFSAWSKIRAQSDVYDSAFVLGGYSALKLGQLADAELLLHEATTRFPQNVFGHLFFADTARASGNWTLAVERLTRIEGEHHDQNLLEAVLQYVLDAPDVALVAPLIKILVRQPFSRNQAPCIVSQLNTLTEMNPPAARRLASAFNLFSESASPDDRNGLIFRMMQILCCKDLPHEELEKIVELLFFEHKIDYLAEIFHWGTYEAGTALARAIHRGLTGGGRSKTAIDLKQEYAVLASFMPAAANDVLKHARDQLKDTAGSSVDSCISAGAMALSMAAPSLSGYRSRLRIAVCVSGQLRGYETAVRTWGRLGLGEHDCHYFVHTWSNIGRKFPVPQHAQRVFSGPFLDVYQNAFMHLGHAVMERMYPSLFRLFTHSSHVTFRDLQNTYRTDSIVIEDDQSEKFQGFNNFEKMYYKIKLCHGLAVMSGREYDLFIRIRPDIAIGGITKSLPQLLGEIKERRVIFVDTGPYIHPKVGYVVGDQLAIADRHGMDAYAATYDNTRYASDGFLSDITRDYRPHVNLAESLIASGRLASSQHGMSFDGWHEPTRLTPDILLAAIKQDIAERKETEWDSQFQQACLASIR